MSDSSPQPATLWLYLEGFLRHQGGVSWRFTKWLKNPDHDDETGIKIVFTLSSYSRQYQPRSLLRTVSKMIAESDVEWITPSQDKWRFDLDFLRRWLTSEYQADFLNGTVDLEPEVECRTEFGRRPGQYTHTGTVIFFLSQSMKANSPKPMPLPVEISESLERFRSDHSEPHRTAFLMMQFGQTPAHERIVSAIRDVLKAHGIAGLRADDKEYHADLFPNVQTYLHGCGFGIAIFERIEGEQFNPNVALEVGYMMAMGKPVCLLKDRTLTALHTDMIGKLYRQFDTQRPAETIPEQIERWLRDKGFIQPPPESDGSEVAVLL